MQKTKTKTSTKIDTKLILTIGDTKIELDNDEVKELYDKLGTHIDKTEHIPYVYYRDIIEKMGEPPYHMTFTSGYMSDQTLPTNPYKVTVTTTSKDFDEE